ncbi:MAG: FMN-dependent alpha-hydroxy acid dehydrogenase [Bryobacterales bacterium]|nr:FMN-dependent alpha-hydroxy acid dehydrogenase [Bryobacterales bacterium]
MQNAGELAGRIAPVAELLNTYEIGAMAQRKVDAATWALLAPADRKAFDRITFRPRLMVNTTGLNLTLELFGEKHFAPIIVGPVSRQKRFHAEGELEMAKGAAAAKAAMVIAADSSFPLDQIISLAKAGAWFQVSTEGEMAKATQAISAGCKAICITGTGWRALAAFAKTVQVPVIAKGIMTPADAEAAIGAGAKGLIVSSYNTTSKLDPIEVLPTIVDAVKGRVPVLVDGGFRRGSDILKGLALGARAILVARAPACGLAAYGAPGVQRALEILQTDLGRDMAMCGKVDLTAIGRDTVKIHRF